MSRPNWIVTLALIAAVAAIVGCGDNRSPSSAGAQADGGAPPDGGPFHASSIAFVPDEGAPDGRIWLELEEARPLENAFTLRVMGDGIDAYGVAGRLLFDTSVTTIVGATAGEALAGGDAEILAAGAGNGKGGFFGVSRSLGERAAVPLTADRVIGTLSFTVEGPGETRIRFNGVRSLVIDAQAGAVTVGSRLGGTLIVK
ncbi:MAG: hypothetical protein HY906_09470 [Deltaproteobacteria bacterium]|nr:hypothetical protein [Deltaproteobacteria bacterium]